ncbi:MAG: DUF4118 domain-containing protein [Gammaproteobacteria bacterium]|nr:DUF4118 domain-containing protein [Gammaproteobacteria bacterium]
MTEHRMPAANRNEPGVTATDLPRELRPLRERAGARLLALAVTTLLIGVALAVGMFLEHQLRLPNILLVFLPVVLFAAARYGLLAASWASVLSVLATSYFLAPPTLSFAVSDPSNIWALLIFLAVAIVTSGLAAQARSRAAAADRHSRMVEALYEFSSTLGAISDGDALSREAAQRIEALLQSPVVMLLPGDDSLRPVVGSLSATPLNEMEFRAASRCRETGLPAGHGTGTDPGARYLFLPLEAGRGTLGVIGLAPQRQARSLNAERNRLLDTLIRLVAINLERAELAHEIRQSEILSATENLRAALLTSISHDFRTPLASILGNVSSLREYGHLYDERTRQETLAATEEETRRLSLFVDNLLHMTRIDAAALRPTMEPVDLSDLIGSALQRVEKRLAGQRVRTVLDPDLPMVPLDFVLAEHVLVNVLENAAKFSPAGTEITITAKAEHREVVLQIEDEGPGIPAADLSRIFDRFHRASVADHRPAGVGLGLSVCKGFVDAMGGRIVAGNRTSGPGAVITIRLPLALAENRE